MTAVHPTPEVADRERPRPHRSDAATERIDTLVDTAAVLVLSAIALLGLETVFDSARSSLVGLVGTVAGGAVALLSARRRLGATTTVLAAGAAFVLFGAPATPDASVAGVVPGPATPWALAQGLATSWADVLTTAPPVALSGGVGVIPYLLGFLSALGGLLLARRTTTTLAPALPALAAAVTTWVLGTRTPASVLAQGAGFVAVAVGWAALRANRERREPGGEIHVPRAASAVAMLVLVVAAGLLCAPLLPFTGGDRAVVRDEVVPPFDPRDHPSPLAAFRAYREQDAKDQVLFTARGLEEGTLVRLAVMDTYDGVVWIVGGDDGGGTGRFERVGRDILPVPDGPSTNATLTAEAYAGVWVPTVGATRSVRFDGRHRDQLLEAFRYNRQTSAGGSPVPMVGGDAIDLDAVHLPISRPAEREDLDVGPAPVDSRVSLPALDPSDILDEVTAGAVGQAATPYEQAVALEQWMSQEGYYSDGDDADPRAVKPAPGHSLFRLERFVGEGDDGVLVGNDEQYAAAMAFMARRIGLPARVVLGFAPEDPTVLTGADVTAWVEIAFEGFGWLPFFPTPDESRIPPDRPQQEVVEEELAQQEPPQSRYIRPPDPTPELANVRPRPPQPEDAVEGLRLPAWVGTVVRLAGPPVVVLGTIVGALLGAKAVRRRRRRTQGTPVQRIAGAWAELIDRRRDEGGVLPPRATRSEQALALASPGWPDAVAMSGRVDALMFGPDEPDDAAARQVWIDAEAQRKAMRKGLRRRSRLRAALSTRSLRRSPGGRR